FFQLFTISELKNRAQKSVVSLYTKKEQKQEQIKIILTNLFTTLCCQRKRIRDKLNFSLRLFTKRGGGDRFTPNITIF
ncbi:MAG: hypothetical protein IJ952_07015, partial [Alistipes sp.]|nr:hypothetical protein [Alistipes sp.]